MVEAYARTLGDLANPAAFVGPIELGQVATRVALAHFDAMVRIRTFEELVGDLVESGEARCPCHLAIGQEAVAVGVASALRRTDRVFGGHRSHAHYLAMGGDALAGFAEILGRASGCAGGNGGSMHLVAREQGFHGSVPIVAATLPIAVGAALAAKKDKRGDVAVVYFGDGAAEEGVLHECLNLAASMQLPVLFVCENNFFASHLDIKLRQPFDRVSRFAWPHGIDVRVVDGNDVVAVSEAATQLVGAARLQGRPAFLEAVTYRWRGHVGPDENIDVGLRRKAEDVLAWKRRDPIARMHAALAARLGPDAVEFADIQKRHREELLQVVEFAKLAPPPSRSALTQHVYA